MIPEQNLPETLEIPEGQDSRSRDFCKRVGYSGHGTIYQAQNGKRFYRLLPHQQMPIKRRNDFQNWLKRGGSPYFAAPSALYQTIENPVTDGYFILRYECRSSADAFLDKLCDENVYVRLDACLKAIKAFYTVHENERNFLPYPTDIVLLDGQDICFLGLPSWEAVDLAASLGAYERGLYLAPEYIRGQKTQLEDAQSYVLGCLLWMSFHPAKNLSDVPHFLQHLANGTLFKSPYFENKVPFWFRHIEVYHSLLELAQGFLKANPEARRRYRDSISLEHFISRLDSAWEEIQPHRAVEILRAAGDARAAMNLLREILGTEKSYDLLCLAGDLAKTDLNQPLEAIDFLESAIALDPQNEQAYYAQFLVFVEYQMHIFFAELFERANKQAQMAVDFEPILRQYEDKIERDYQHLGKESQEKEFKNYVYYFIHQGQYQKAAKLVHPQLFDAAKKFLWFKFDLNLLYLEILIYQKQFDNADNQLRTIRNGLQKVTENRTLPPQEIKEHGKRLSELEVFLLKAKQAR